MKNISMNSDEFILACWHGDLDAVKQWLATGGELEARSSWSGAGPLIARDPEVFRFLIEAGANPFPDDYGILGLQVWELCEENVNLLLSLGVSAKGECLSKNMEPDTGETPLHAAVGRPDNQWKRLRIVKSLLKHDADPNQAANVGIPSPCFWRNVKVVGETPLHRAGAYASKTIIKKLLDAGGDPKTLDARDETPQSWASRAWRDLDTIKLLEPL